MANAPGNVSSYNIAPGESTDAAAMRRKMAYALMQQGSEAAPIQHWAQGLARLGQSAIGGYELYQEDQKDNAEKAKGRELMTTLLAGGGGTAAQAAPPDQPLSLAMEPRGIRNANPLNIEDGPFARLQPGYAGGDGRFAKFASLDQGSGAANALLDVYERKHGLNTVSGIVGRWAPAGDGNNVSAYAGNVSKQLGIDPNAPVPPEMRQKLIAAMAQHENGRPVSGLVAPPAVSSTAQPAALGTLAPPAPQPMPNVNRETLAAMLSNKYTAPMAQQVIAGLLAQQFKPNEYGFSALPNGTIVRQNPRTGQVEPVYQAPSKPTYGVVGKDEFNIEKYGWIDPFQKTTEVTPLPGQQQTAPANVPPVAPGTAGAPQQPQAPMRAVPQAPPGVDPKIFRDKHSERFAENSMPPDQKSIKALRDEVRDLPSYKNLAQAAPVYKSMLDAAGRDNRAADVNIIYGMAKIMDPGSVVRESEMTIAQAVATLPQKLRADVESTLTSTGRLSPAVREAIMGEAMSRIGAYQSVFDQDIGMYKGIVERGRMNPLDVIPTFGPFDPYKPAKPPAPGATGAVTAPRIVAPVDAPILRFDPKTGQMVPQ